MRNTFRQAITAVAGKSRRALAAESRIVIHANGFAVAERRPNCTRLGHLRLLQCVYCERKQEMNHQMRLFILGQLNCLRLLNPARRLRHSRPICPR